jgi:hypothetical protein
MPEQCSTTWIGAGAPITELGHQHNAWVRSRGLPHGLDDHDHD